MPRNAKKKKAKQAAAEAPPAAPEGTVEYYKTQGNRHFAKGAFSEAVTEYQAAIDLFGATEAALDGGQGGLARLFSNLSAALLRSQRCPLPGGDPLAPGPVSRLMNWEEGAGAPASHVEEALRAAERCVAQDPAWAKGHYRKGHALLLLDRPREAKAAFTAGVERSPDGVADGPFAEALRAVEKRLVVLDIAEEEAAQRTMPDMQDFVALTDWLDAGGAQYPHLYIRRYSPTYRGVHARRPIPRETQIMKIPVRFLITVEMGKNCPIGLKMQRAAVDLSAKKHCYLSVYSLWDYKSNVNSFFLPYYRILPQTYEVMPIFWSEAEMELLQGSHMITQIKDRRRNIAADYEEILRAAPEFADFASLDDFKWARMMVASRNFGITINELKTDALVPYADMLNHKRPRETRWSFDDAQTAFTITTLDDLGAGGEVMDSYGKKCNSRFLLNYGFTVEHNRDADGHCHNEVRFWIELDPQEMSYAHKVSLNDGDPGLSSRISMYHWDGNSKETWSFLRFACASGAEILQLPDLSDYSVDLEDSPIAPMSCATELKVLALLRRLCEEALDGYPTTYEEDKARLATDELSPFSNARNAVVLRTGEKEVLLYLLRLVAEAEPLLRAPWKDVKATIRKQYYNLEDGISRYISEVVADLVRDRGTQ